MVATWRELGQARADLETARTMLTDLSGDDRDVVQAEVASAELAIAELGERLNTLLLPKDPNDGRNVISRSAGPRAARRPTSSPGTCSPCTSATRPRGAGRPRCCR